MIALKLKMKSELQFPALITVFTLEGRVNSKGTIKLSIDYLP